MSRSERRIRRNRNRRIRERRKHILFIFLTFCLILTLSFTASSFLSSAKPKAEEGAGKCYKCYKSIIIEKGDTLWSIALRNMNYENYNINAYIQEIMQMNGLSDDTITAGMYLVIPYYYTGAAMEPKTPPQSAP